MTSEEFITLAKGMKAAYSSHNFLPDDESMKLWYRLLKDIDGQIVAAAVYKHISSSKFPPTIAEIREASASIQAPEDKDWLEGWGAVIRAIGRHGWCGEKAALSDLHAFDPLTADVVRKLGWRNLCMSENQTADRANFRQAYEVCRSRNKELAKLPPSLNNLRSGLSERFMLTGETP